MSVNLSSLVLKSGTPTPSKVPGAFLEKVVVEQKGVHVYFNIPVTETDLNKRWVNSRTRSDLVKNYKIAIFSTQSVLSYDDYGWRSVKNLFSPGGSTRHDTLSINDCLSNIINSTTQKEYQVEKDKLRSVSDPAMKSSIFLLPFRSYIPFTNESEKVNFSIIVVPHLITAAHGVKLSLKPELYGDYIVENVLINGYTPRERQLYKETGTQRNRSVTNSIAGRVWPRPSAVHSHGGKTMTGYYHTRRPHTELSRETVKDLKIINKKFISDMFKRHEVFSLPKEKNGSNIIMKKNNVDSSSKNWMKKLNGSTDANGYYRCVFYFNFLEFIKDNLPYSYLLKNMSDLQLENLLKNMSNITIEISKYYIGKYKDKMDKKKKTLLVSGKLSKTGDLIKSANANIQEIDLNLNDKKFNFPHVRHFALTDFHHADSALGAYSYSVDIRCDISKPWLKMLNKHMKTLDNDLLKTSKEYENLLKNNLIPANNINIISHPGRSVISEEKRKMNTVVSRLIDVLDLLSYNGVTEEERNNYIAEFDKYFDDNYVDAENVSYFVNLTISEVSKKLSDVTLTLGGSNKALGQSSVNLASFSGGGTSTLSADIRNKGQVVTGASVRKIFGEKDVLERVVKFSNKGTGIRYMPIISNNSTIGPNRISLGNLNARAQEEFNKYFHDSQFLNEVADMTKEKHNRTLDLNYNRYTYFSPVDISLPETKDVSLKINKIKDVFNWTTRFNKLLIEVQRLRDPDLGNRPSAPIPYEIEEAMDVEKHKAAFNLLNYLSQNSSVQGMGMSSFSIFMGEDRASSISPDDPEEQRESNGKFKEDVEGQNEEIEFFNRLKNKSSQNTYMKKYTEQMYNLLMPLFETEIYGKLFPLFHNRVPYGNNLLNNESVLFEDIQNTPMQVKALMNIMMQRTEEQDENKTSFHLFKQFQENRNEVAGLLFMNFVNLMQMEMLIGYKKDANGDVTATPIYEVITSDLFNSMAQANKPTLCRLRQYTNKKFNIESKTQQDVEVGNKLLPIFPLYDEVFLVEQSTSTTLAGISSAPAPTTTTTPASTATTAPVTTMGTGGGSTGGGGGY